MKYFIVLMVFFSLLSFKSGTIYSQSYELVWSDEFDYTGLPDEGKWGYDVGGGGWGNNELQFYTDARLENARVENGQLIIEARKESYGGRDYTSARLITKDNGDWLYGKIEIRAKLPGGTGSWPAIWMLPTDWVYGGWPSSGEIDIMEYVGYDPGVVHATVHTEAYNHTLGTQVGQSINVPDAESAFHVYSIKWTDTKIEAYVDDIKYFTFQSNNDYTKWPFDERFHLLLNIAIGGSWGGVQGVDNTIFPVQMEVDYVRVYQVSATSNKNIENESQFKIYPNPVAEHIRVSSTNEFSEIEIYSISGKKVLIYNHSSKKHIMLNVSELKTGVYYLIAKNKEGQITVLKKFIKK